MNKHPSILLHALAVAALAFSPALRGQPSASLTVLHVFAAHDHSPKNTDGANPDAALVEGSDGSFYGTADAGGPGQNGTIFKITASGTFTLLHTFGGSRTNGPYANPAASLIQGTDGNFYGTTYGGGGATQNGQTVHDGTIFRMTPGGSMNLLHSFNGDDGANPSANLLLASDGNFYGLTGNGGAHQDGTLYQLTPGGVFSSVHDFDGTDGRVESASGLIEGSDGKFYGVTRQGGADDLGTVFVTTGTGTRTLHEFNGDDGELPEGSLVQASDGNFYGTTGSGGAHNVGTIFRMTPDGTLTTLYSFTALSGDTHNPDGAFPVAGLVQGNDGNFYGAAYQGGTGGNGTIFQLTPAGTFTALHQFGPYDQKAELSNADGVAPLAALIQGRDGRYYGTTADGGAGGTGVVFALLVSPAITSANTASGVVGEAFSFQVTAGNGPASFSAVGLPGGLQINGATGAISGAPTAAGTTSVTVLANNGAGSGSAVLTIKVLPPSPKITSKLTADATQGSAFSYQITASNDPASFGALGLPPGLHIDGKTGIISGTPTKAGTFQLTLEANNAGGQGLALLKLTVAAAPPEITSALTANATQGSAFNYQITASNNPASFGVLGLPPGLTVDAKTGVISGAPTVSGTKSLTLKATNGAGTGTAMLSLTIQGAPPAVTSATTATATVGQAFNYQITATNQPTGFGVLGLPPGLHVDGKTGIISGTPTKAGTFHLTLKATNATGTGQATLTLTIKPN